MSPRHTVPHTARAFPDERTKKLAGREGAAHPDVLAHSGLAECICLARGVNVALSKSMTYDH